MKPVCAANAAWTAAAAEARRGIRGRNSICRIAIPPIEVAASAMACAIRIGGNSSSPPAPTDRRTPSRPRRGSRARSVPGSALRRSAPRPRSRHHRGQDLAPVRWPTRSATGHGGPWRRSCRCARCCAGRYRREAAASLNDGIGAGGPSDMGSLRPPSNLTVAPRDAPPPRSSARTMRDDSIPVPHRRAGNRARHAHLRPLECYARNIGGPGSRRELCQLHGNAFVLVHSARAKSEGAAAVRRILVVFRARWPSNEPTFILPVSAISGE